MCNAVIFPVGVTRVSKLENGINRQNIFLSWSLVFSVCCCSCFCFSNIFYYIFLLISNMFKLISFIIVFFVTYFVVFRWFARLVQASCWQKRRNSSSWITWNDPTWLIFRNEGWKRKSLINAAKGQSVRTVLHLMVGPPPPHFFPPSC